MLTAESFAANFTNERGVDDRIRYLRNVMGLWVLQQCVARVVHGRTRSTSPNSSPPPPPSPPADRSSTSTTRASSPRGR